MNRTIRKLFVLLLIGLALVSCANTVNGFIKDNRNTASAVDSTTHRVLSAGAKGSRQ